jgi:DNA mismatch endonuclease, patch repair protein
MRNGLQHVPNRNQLVMTQDSYPKEKRSWVMSRIKSENTSPELTLRKQLWSQGLRYRKNLKTLPGRPDIVFQKVKLVVFVDGAFWHGKKLSKARLKKMSPYWQEKIRKNVARDKKTTLLLKNMGFTVIRVTDKQLTKHLTSTVNQIIVALEPK